MPKGKGAFRQIIERQRARAGFPEEAPPSAVRLLKVLADIEQNKDDEKAERRPAQP